MVVVVVVVQLRNRGSGVQRLARQIVYLHPGMLVQQNIVQNGGMFSPLMQKALTTHLVADAEIGDKCKFARAWAKQDSAIKIKIVKSSWIDECLAKGSYVAETPYLLPELEEILATTNRAQRKRKREDELLTAQEQETKRLSLIAQQHERELELFDEYKASGEQLDVMDKFVCFLHGFETRNWRTCRFLTQCTGAIVYFEFTRNVTHLLVGAAPNEEYIKHLKELNPSLVQIDMNFTINFDFRFFF